MKLTNNDKLKTKKTTTDEHGEEEDGLGRERGLGKGYGFGEGDGLREFSKPWLGQDGPVF